MKGKYRAYRTGIAGVYYMTLAGCLYGLFCGCLAPPNSPHDSASLTAQRAELSPLRGRSSPADAGSIHVVDLAFDVIRIDMPADGIRHSLKIWNHVDEMRIGAETVAQLARNGVRMGIATDEGWTAMRVIFDACEARWEQQQMIGQRGLPLSIEIGAVESSEPIFYYDARHKLQGKTFSAGKKLVNLGFGYRPELGGVIDLQVGMEVRHDRGVMAWEKRGGVIREVPAFDRKVFHDLDVSLSLNPGEFLILGPSARAAETYLIGSRFFTRDEGGSAYEIMFFIAPKPYQSQVSDAGRGGS